MSVDPKQELDTDDEYDEELKTQGKVRLDPVHNLNKPVADVSR